MPILHLKVLQPRSIAVEPYDPERYWDAKARGARDAFAAVCLGDPLRDRCIDRMQRALMRRAFDCLRPRFAGAPASLLDVGCGAGRWAETSTRRGFAYTGIDISETMVEVARRENEGHRFYKFDGERVPFDDAAFDVVLSLAVLHHNPYPRQDALLDEIVRVLKPGGALVIFEGVGPRRPTGAGVFHYRPRDDWRACLEGRGLAVEWHRGATYFTLERIVQKFLPERLLPRGIVLRVGATLDPYLIPFIPQRFHDRWMALLWKGLAQGRSPAAPDATAVNARPERT